jgi:glycerol-3-phosphate cytidylyltransferase
MNLHIKLIKYVNNNNIKMISILNDKFLVFGPDIKFYFKNITINFYMTEDINKNNCIFLNYVDNIYCSNEKYINILNKYNYLFNNKKPNIYTIRVISFGTFDLFHIGHTNILKRAKEYGNLTVGVSTDELNLKKGKKSINNLEKRKLDVQMTNFVDFIFDEESLELKNEYVKKYNCNLLIIGDDWKNKFNFCDCACLYLPRTPDISTTMLKENLK